MRQMNITGEYDCAREWDRIISKSIVKKYTDMRCNINAAVRDAYKREYCCLHTYYIHATLTLTYIRPSFLLLHQVDLKSEGGEVLVTDD